MDAATLETWSEIFERAAEREAERVRRIRFEAAYDRMEEKKLAAKKADQEEQKEREELEALTATQAQIAAFETQLDGYDTRTVQALMQNGEALDRVRSDLNKMRDDAYVLPDGRRVFKTADGHRVMDEHGTELTDSVDPATVENSRPRWETFKARQDDETRLLTERHGLLEFQAKLDHARERVGKGDISKKDLDDLGADLAASAPAAVRQQPDPTTPRSVSADRPTLTASQPALPSAVASDDLGRRVTAAPAPM